MAITDAHIERVGSHHLTWATTRSALAGEPFEREELFPDVVMTVPRAGTISARFSVDRYVYSSSAGERMGDWRIYCRDVREHNPDDPNGYAPDAKGIGPATRQQINEVGEPLVREWLAGYGYKVSRRKAAAYAYRRELHESGLRAYNVERLREKLAAIADELAPPELSTMKQATELVAQTVELLDREPIG